MLLSKFLVCDSKKSKFFKEKTFQIFQEQETSGLMSSLGMKTHLRKIPLIWFSFILKVLAI